MRFSSASDYVRDNPERGEFRVHRDLFTDKDLFELEMAHIFEGGHTLSLFGEVSGVGAEVELLWASKGNFPREGYEALIADMPNARITDVNAGHLIPMEEPEIVVAAALALLE